MPKPVILMDRGPAGHADKGLATKGKTTAPIARQRLAASRMVLTSTIQSEVVPRIVLAQRARPKQEIASKDDGPPFGKSSIAKFAALVLGSEVETLSDHIATVRASGQPLERIYLRLLSPAAVELGELWDADQISLSEVTIGLGRLQRLLHWLSPAFEAEGEGKSDGRLALFMPAPGEQHTYGISMAAEFLRRDGWDVVCWPAASTAELVDIIRHDYFALVGLSATSDDRVAAVAACIRRIRRHSQNPDIGVMVGGPLFLRRPELVTLVGADCTAGDGRQAAIQARHLLDLLPSGSREGITQTTSQIHDASERHPAFATEDAAE